MIRTFVARAAAALMVCALSAGCSAHGARGVARVSGMGMDAYGHTRMSETRESVPPDEMAHTQRLLAILRRELVRYRDPAAAERDGYRREGEDVPVGSLKHFFKYENFAKNQDHLDPEAPAAILYRRTPRGFELAGVMFTAPITASMDELDKRIPLALGHWHSHRNICVPRRGSPPLRTHAERAPFGFEGTINTRAACDAAGGVFLDNVYGWMTHVYPYAPTLAEAF
ncbi:MAG TPA: hypothetical protein VHS78_07165 [Candidatus Elarobacter sp.]|jgi:hypothetical protein|nr:hypothetical protein [Candidatus Elarobacter sp.]